LRVLIWQFRHNLSLKHFVISEFPLCNGNEVDPRVEKAKVLTTIVIRKVGEFPEPPIPRIECHMPMHVSGVY